MLSTSFDISRSTVKPIDLHKEKASRKSKSLAIQGNRLGMSDSLSLDFNVWLPKAAEVYNISKDIRDYILVPVPVNISEIPNTNGDSFSLREWTTFNPNQGDLAFRTFKGKPTYVEHQENTVFDKARGVIVDNHLSPLRGFRGNHAKLTLLLAFDKTKDPLRCDRILKGELNTYSKGTTYKAYACSVCGRIVTPKLKNFCEHTDFKRPTRLDFRTGKLVYRDCIGLTGFECSSVDDPAFACAASYQEHLLRMRR